MVPLARTSDEAQTIIKFIENSGSESTVSQIFKVNIISNIDIIFKKL